MSQDDEAQLSFLPATELIRLFRQSALSPVDLMRRTVDQCERINPIVNALVDTLFEEALEQAHIAEERYRRGTARPLEGIPVAVKAQQPMKGRPWQDGSLALRDRVATVDHPVVRRVRAAGGIIHARTATPEFCCMPFTHSTLWGTTRNPWNLELSPGGSSGGSVAALAAGMTVLATGSDSGGSLRSPAAFTGTVGFKAPYGTVPTIFPAALDPFWQDGALARTVSDCDLLHEVLAGHDPVDMASLVRGPRPLARTDSMRVALLANLGNFVVDEEIAQDVVRVAQALAAAGSVVEPAELYWDSSTVNAIADAHFGDHGAVDIGLLAADCDDITDYAQNFATRTTAAAQRLRPQQRHREAGKMYRDIARLFERFDAILCPTVGITGLIAGNSFLADLPAVNGQSLKTLSDINLTRPFNILNRLPAIAVPSGRIAASGLPLGVQIVGRPYDEHTVLSLAQTIEDLAEPIDYGWAVAAAGHPAPPRPISRQEPPHGS